MHRSLRRWGWMGAFALLASLVAALPAAADATSFSGQATAIDATVLGNRVVLGDTGPLDAGGGAKESSLLAASVPGVLTADVLHATVVGHGDRSRANVSVAEIAVTVGGHNVSATLLAASATARCGPNGAAISGSAEIVDLVVDGQHYEASGTPGQRISLPDGSFVVINEQTGSASGNSGTITVNALRIVVPGVADIVIASAHADIMCAGAAAPCRADFVTGGGWIDGHGGKANFAVAGGIRNGGYWGHLQYRDHGDGTTIKGTGVTMYTSSAPRVRHIEGTAEVNGRSGTYKVDVDDEAEPGRDADTFNITASNGASTYTAGGTLRGGNIQLHCP